MNRSFCFLGIFVLAVCAVANPDAYGQSLQLLSLRESSQPPPAGGNGDSLLPLVTGEGRYVLFASTANNLVVATNGLPIPLSIPPRLNVYLRDRVSNTTALVSANITGTNGGNGDSIPSAISGNGLYALLESAATDLVANDTNKTTDIFVRDLQNGTTTLITVGTNGVNANGTSRAGVMTADGRYVAFVSLANNLVPGDTNKVADVFVRDLLTQTTTLVSSNATATTSTPLVNSSESPRITPNGRYVAFLSSCTNLVPGITTTNDVYVCDVASGITVCASANARTVLQTVFGSTNGSFYNQAISEDGKYVAFQGSTNSTTKFASSGIIFRFDRETSALDIVETNAAVQTAPLMDIHSLDMTPDGRFIVFVANTNGSAGTTTCIKLWDSMNGTATLVSGNVNNIVPLNSTCDWPTIDPTGRYVCFIGNAPNMVTNTVSGEYHAYRRDVQTGTTLLMGLDLFGRGPSVNPQTVVRLSSDGRWAAFGASDSSLVADDNNREYDVFISDATSNTVELVSTRSAALLSTSANALSEISQFCVDKDGTHFAFLSDAANLVPNDTNRCRDIFVRNLVAGSTVLASVSTNGVNSGDGMSSEPAISEDGRYLAFSSYAADLVSGDTNATSDVFVRDLQMGATILVSVATNGASSGNLGSSAPAIDKNGRYVLFYSKATTLADGPYTTNSENLFLRDLQLGVTRALTGGGGGASCMTSDGRFVAFYGWLPGGNTNRLYLWDNQINAGVYTNATSTPLMLGVSPDGQRIVIENSSYTIALDRAAGTSNSISQLAKGFGRCFRFSDNSRWLALSRVVAPGFWQVYFYDFQTSSINAVSHAAGSIALASGHSDSAEISPDGRWIIYRSFATNIVQGISDATAKMILYDRFTGTNTLLATSRAVMKAPNNRSFAPFFSRDGRSVLFQSSASDLVEGDANHSADVFAYRFFYATLSTLTPAPIITWPATAGRTYTVEYKNDLADVEWLPASGSITINGVGGSYVESTSTAGRRFYRVSSF